MRIRILIASFILVGIALLSGQWAVSNPVTHVVGSAQAAQEPPNIYFLPVIRAGGTVVTYRAGQTFITWPEDQTVQGERYRIYRSKHPIMDIHDPGLVLIGEVGKNSAEFYTNRYQNNGVWKLRYVDRLIMDENGQQIPPNNGLFVWTLSKDDFENDQDSGDGFYILTEIRPGEDEKVISASIGPISEAVAPPDPVEITSSDGVSIGAGGHVFIQYMDLRNWNPTFHAPNYTNRYWGVNQNDPNIKYNLQYAYDYDVFTPTPDLCGGRYPDKLPVFVYLHGWNGNTKGGEGDYPHHYCAYGIYPFDDTDTWWFGFASKNDYRLGKNPGAGDVIVNYTEMRLLRMIADLERNPLGPPVDENRIYVAGQSMGATGSLALGERYPNIFAAVYASQPLTDFRTAGTSKSGQVWLDDAAMKFGSSNLNLPIALFAPNGWADPLQKYVGQRGVYDWVNLQEGGSDTRLADETAILGVTHGTNDTVVWYNTQGAPLYYDLNDGRRPWAAVSNDSTHLWQYYIGLPIDAARRPNQNTGVPFWGLTVVKNETVPGFSNLSTNGDMTKQGSFDMSVMWASSWFNWSGAPAPVDETNRWEMSFCAVKIGTSVCGTGNDGETVDITLRRVQNFQIVDGKTYYWRNELKGGGLLKDGTVQAIGGVLTIPKVYLTTNPGNRLIVTPK